MKRQHNKQEIAQLLSKFMAGQTSLDEEQVLAQYFRTHEVDEKWTEYKEMFALFDNGEVDIELETETSEHLNNGNNGKTRMLPKTVRVKPKIVALKWLAALAAACVLLLLMFHFRQNQAEEKTIVNKVVKRGNPQTVSPPIVKKKKDGQLAEVQPITKPVKKQRKAVKRRSTPEKPMLSEAEPKHESAEPVNHPNNHDTAPAISSSMQDPFLMAAAQARAIRSRGERLHQEISMFMNTPQTPE